jgi:uncharacterized membrane protein YqiK
MDNQQIDYFLDRYSKMSDEELSHLLVTRQHGLSEEAREALGQAVQSRDPTKFQREVNATTRDLKAQAEQSSLAAKQQVEQARSRLEAMRLACVVVFVVGLALLMWGRTEGGIVSCAVGGILFICIELRRLLGRFVAALFNPNSK